MCNSSDPFGLCPGVDGSDPNNLMDCPNNGQQSKESESTTKQSGSGQHGGSCFATEFKTNERELGEAVHDAVGFATKKLIGLGVGMVVSRGLAGSGLATSSKARLGLQWMLGRSAGADMVGEAFGYATVQGIRVGATSGGLALSGTALAVGIGTNLLASASTTAAFYAGTWIGSAAVAVGRCAGR
jgi:hypothetical protein